MLILSTLCVCILTLKAGSLQASKLHGTSLAPLSRVLVAIQHGPGHIFDLL